MKVIACTLLQAQKAFNEDTPRVAKEFCIERDLIPSSVKLLNLKTIQFEFEDYWNDDWIMRILTNLFEDLGGVDVDWDIFNGPITIC